MIYKTFRAVSVAALLVVAFGCTDVTTEPKSTVTGANVFNDPSSYRAFLAKIYAGLAVTGQQGPAGKADIQGIDEGFSQYVRLLWQMEELPTDEAVIAWNDTGVQELNTQIWGTSNQFLQAMYYRIFFQVAMVNEFLRETTDEKLAARGATDALKAQVATYRAEARFLRALSYWHGIDLFGNIPLVVETDPIGSTPPQQATRADLFNYVESELKAIQNQLPSSGAVEYGRASSAAATMLLAKLYMNSQVYTGTQRYSDARAAVEQVIASPGISLDPSYKHLFLADNNTSKEIIFPVPQDGKRTQSYGGTTFIIHAAVGGDMNANAFGVDGGWWGLRVKPEIPALFTVADKRGTFFTQNQTLAINNLTNFQEGYATVKYQNVTSTGAPGSDFGFMDTDYPMFRLGDAYLMYAEAVLRNGGGTRQQALSYVNALRERAWGNTNGNITDAQLTLGFLKDELSRELFWEGHRRTDLVRFGQFTDQGVWAWKGGVKAGKVTESFRNLYPLPASELLANPNLTQNTGY
ncbi:MAG TPA: RagB/SusD family nutrient uptake outer membrane protein [Gemmatimonadaceae bacterium]|nr:RagB/SusD family nutrient uptake outer membrane protein [Gemmatimonadaceae bacterium]